MLGLGKKEMGREGVKAVSPFSSNIDSAAFPFKWFEQIPLWGPGIFYEPYKMKFSWFEKQY